MHFSQSFGIYSSLSLLASLYVACESWWLLREITLLASTLWNGGSSESTKRSPESPGVLGWPGMKAG